MTSVPPNPKPAIAVYCGSSTSKQKAHTNAAISLGHALAKENRPLVYGGGSYGLMGLVSNTVLADGGSVTGVIPHVMHSSGGEKEKVLLEANDIERDQEIKHKNMETIVVSSMHERKVEMAKRSAGFIGLPGGFGTFEEILEVTTWTQLGIHVKPVVLLNVLSYFDPLRNLIRNGVAEGYITPSNADLITFVDGPASHQEHEGFNWGAAGLQAIEAWRREDVKPLYDWTNAEAGNGKEEGNLSVV